MAQPGNKGYSELGPNGSSRRHKGKRTHGERFQTKPQQDFAKDPNGNWTHQEESMECNGMAIETVKSWQDHPGPSQDSRRPPREDKSGYHAGAKVQTQTLPWQDHPGPYENSPDGSWPGYGELGYGELKGYNLAAGLQTPSWQDHPGPFKNVPDKNRSHESERIEQNDLVFEKTPLWQDHIGSSETIPNGSRPRQGNQTEQKAGAVLQKPSVQDHAWPYGNSPGRSSPHHRDQREHASSAALPRRSLQSHPRSFENNPAQRSPSHEKSWERAAPVCLPYHQWTQGVRDQETHPKLVAPKELQFFNPEWAPYPPAQETAPTTTHPIAHPSTRHKTAREAIQAHLGMKKGRKRGQNSSSKHTDAGQQVIEGHDRNRPKVFIPKRQCYNESKPGNTFPNRIPPLEPVTSTHENGHHDVAQEDKYIPTVCLPGKDCYGDQILHCSESGEFKANGARRPGEL